VPASIFEEPAMKTVAANTSSRASEPFKLLLVEDDPWMADFVMSLLAKYPEYAAVRMPNGLAACRHLSENAVDLILTDILMPEMDGIELIQQRAESMADTPIIAFSGGGFRLDQKELLKYAAAFGAKRILEKPVKPERLLGAIRDVLAESKK
jgi:CheY-like chemotaxis protein